MTEENAEKPVGNSQPEIPAAPQPGWFLRHPKLSLLFLLLAVAALFVFMLDASAGRGRDSRLAAIRARGEPTTIADLLAKHTIPPEENRTVGVAEAGERIKVEAISMSEEENQTIGMFGVAPSTPTGQLWPEHRFNISNNFVLRMSDELRVLHVALKRPRGALQIAWSTPAINTLMPQMSQIRMSARAWALETIVEAQRRNRKRVETNLLEGSALVYTLNGDGAVIGALVAYATKALYLDVVEQSINLCSIDSRTLEQLQRDVQHLERFPDVRNAFLVERVMFIDTMNWFRTAGFKAINAMGLTSSAVSGWVPILRSMDFSKGLDQYTAIVQAVSGPDALIPKRMSAIDTQAAQIPWYCMNSRVMIPSLSRSAELWLRNIGTTRAMVAAIAAERYRLDTGRWPERLEDLVPKYLDAVPIDPIDGRPIRYARFELGIKMWTISDDFKNADDGGDVNRLDENMANRKARDFGWVILNPDQRRRPPPATSQPVDVSQEHQRQ